MTKDELIAEFKELVDAGEYLDINGKSNILSFIEGNEEIAKECINDFFIYAVEKGQLSVVKLLIEQFPEIPTNVNKDNQCDKLLKLAIKSESEGLIEFLVKTAGIAVDNNDLILYVAASGCINTLEYLIATKKANVNTKNNSNNTPLHFAVSQNHLQMVKYLIEKKADVNAENNNNTTSLHLAAKTAHLDIVKYLIEKGADVNAIDKDGKTPLHCAISNNTTEVCKELISKMEDDNLKYKGPENLYYLSYLLYAIVYNKPLVVENLLKRGANFPSTEQNNEKLNDFLKGFLSNLEVKVKSCKPEKLREEMSNLNQMLYYLLGYKGVVESVELKDDKTLVKFNDQLIDYGYVKSPFQASLLCELQKEKVRSKMMQVLENQSDFEGDVDSIIYLYLLKVFLLIQGIGVTSISKADLENQKVLKEHRINHLNNLRVQVQQQNIQQQNIQHPNSVVALNIKIISDIQRIRNELVPLNYWIDNFFPSSDSLSRADIDNKVTNIIAKYENIDKSIADEIKKIKDICEGNVYLEDFFEQGNRPFWLGLDKVSEAIEDKLRENFEARFGGSLGSVLIVKILLALKKEGKTPEDLRNSNGEYIIPEDLINKMKELTPQEAEFVSTVLYPKIKLDKSATLEVLLNGMNIPTIEQAEQARQNNAKSSVLGFFQDAFKSLFGKNAVADINLLSKKDVDYSNKRSQPSTSGLTQEQKDQTPIVSSVSSMTGVKETKAKVVAAPPPGSGNNKPTSSLSGGKRNRSEDGNPKGKKPADGFNNPQNGGNETTNMQQLTQGKGLVAAPPPSNDNNPSPMVTEPTTSNKGKGKAAPPPGRK